MVKKPPTWRKPPTRRKRPQPELQPSTPPAPAVELPELNEPTTVVIRGVPVDLAIARTTFEQVERQYRMNETGNYLPTPQFLLDAAQSLRDVGVTDCTPTDAYVAWFEVWDKFLDLKKKHPRLQR